MPFCDASRHSGRRSRRSQAGPLRRQARVVVLLLLVSSAVWPPGCTIHEGRPLEPSYTCTGMGCEDCESFPPLYQHLADLCRACNGAPCSERPFTPGAWNCDGLVCRDGKTVFHYCAPTENCSPFEGETKCCSEFANAICNGGVCVRK